MKEKHLKEVGDKEGDENHMIFDEFQSSDEDINTSEDDDSVVPKNASHNQSSNSLSSEASTEESD